MPQMLDIGSVSVTAYNGIYYVNWKIDGFFFRCPSQGEIWKSKYFLMWDETWRFELYPNGNSTFKESISLYLSSTTFSKINTVSYKLGIKTENGSTYKYSESKITTQTFFECSNLLEKSELTCNRSVIAPNGRVTFSAVIQLHNSNRAEKGFQKAAKKDEVEDRKEKTEGGAKEDGISHQEDGVHSKDKEEKDDIFDLNDVAVLTESLKNLFLNEKNCDVKIKVGEHEFNAHKLILSARSPVFASMFEHEMIENRSGIINIPDCDPNAFRDFLLYMYAAKVDNFSKENVVGLHFIADKYDVKQLALQCLKFMAKNISVESFCEILRLSVKYNESELIGTAEQFFAKNMQKILVTVQWQSFLKENPTVANELFIKCAKRLNL